MYEEYVNHLLEKNPVLQDLPKAKLQYAVENFALEGIVRYYDLHGIFPEDKYLPWIGLFTARDTLAHHNGNLGAIVLVNTIECPFICKLLDMENREMDFYSSFGVLDHLIGAGFSATYAWAKTKVFEPKKLDKTRFMFIRMWYLLDRLPEECFRNIRNEILFPFYKLYGWDLELVLPDFNDVVEAMEAFQEAVNEEKA